MTSLVLNPAVAVVRCTNDEVFIKLGSRSTGTHRITDSDARGQLADFVELFTQPRTTEDAAAQAGIAPETAQEFVDALREGKALIDESERDFGFFLAGLRTPSLPQQARVAVLGEGRVAEAVCRQLGDALQRDVTITADVEAAFDEHDFVVVASDRMRPDLGYDADQAAETTQTPWQLVFVDGVEAIVGPTFVPGHTGSYYDYDTMDESARTMRMDHLFFKTAPETVPAAAPTPVFVADLAASYAVAAVLQHLTGKGSYLENSVLRIDLERMHVIRDRVMRLPRNPRDMASRDDLRHPFI